MKKMIIALLFFFSLFSIPVFATSTQQFNNIKLSPYYFSTLPQNVNQTMSVTINPPDNIASIISALFHFKVFTGGSTTNYILYVNNKLCGTYLVDTSFANAGQYEIAFDCTSLIQRAGTYVVKLKSDRNAGSFYGWLDLTYMNNPIELISSGTEYLAYENGTVFVRLLTGNSQPINLAYCNTTIYYPNKTKFLNNQLLTFLEKGIYYYDLTLPNITGNYIASFDCIFPAQIFNENRTIGLTLGATFDNTIQYFFYDQTENQTINKAFLEVYSTGSATGSDLQIAFNGQVVGHNLGKTPPIGNFTLNQSNFVLSDAQTVSLTNVGTGTTYIFWIRLYVNYTLTNPTQIIRGQNEINVHDLNQTFASSGLWNKLVGIQNEITSVNDTITATNFSIFGKLYSVQDDLSAIYDLTYASNSSIINKLYAIQDEIASVNDTINANFNTTNSMIISLNSTINALTTTVNYWGNALETKLDGIMMGNVTVTALVDYDEIALTVMQYLKALEKIEVI